MSTAQPTVDPSALPPLLAELRATFEKRQATPTSQTVGITRKQMLDWDEKSLLAGQWRLA